MIELGLHAKYGSALAHLGFIFRGGFFLFPTLEVSVGTIIASYHRVLRPST